MNGLRHLHQALNGITDAYNHNVHKVRNIQNKLMWRHVCDIGEDSQLTTRQANYVFKMHTVYAVFQIHGASFQVFNYVRELEFEMNAANDNPLIFDEDDETLVISGGNFHGQPVALALDHLKWASVS